MGRASVSVIDRPVGESIIDWSRANRLAESKPLMALDSQLDNERVRVVESEEKLVVPLRYNLKRAGYRVLAATDAGEGLEAARAESPGLTAERAEIAEHRRHIDHAGGP